ncbi:MAG: IBR domain-containing protein [Firmicutes bacterium]|nr:IBR domain-containing protein [Bacillota bacterium]
MSGMEQFKCPSCGGAVEFNAGTQNLKCPYCDSEFDIEALKTKEEAKAQKKDDQFSWDEMASNQWAEGETDGLKVYACKACGGEIVGDENMGATTCPYCGNQIVMTGQFSGVLKPDYIIPFKYDKKQAKAAFEEFIRSRQFVPKMFTTQKHIDEIKGIYVPFWLFDADAEGEATYDATVTHITTNGKYQTTEIKHYSATREGTMKFNKVPVDGSSRIADDMMESIEPFYFDEAVEFNTAYLAGYAADKYDVSDENSIERANERIKKSVELALEQTVTGYRKGRHVEIYDAVTPEWSSVDIQNGKAKYALYPVWMLSATYKGKPYTFAMNGQTGKFIGDLPADEGALKKFFWKRTAVIGTIIYVAGIALLLI